MQHLTPAELLSFLEEEATTLELINANIANQLHCLQVEEELFNRELSNLEKGDGSACQSEQDRDEELFYRELSNVEHDESPLLAIESGQSGQGVKEERFKLQLSKVEKDDASVLAIESEQSRQDRDEELFYRELSNVEHDEAPLLAIESGQSGQDEHEELFNCQLSNVENDEVFALGIEPGQSGPDLKEELFNRQLSNVENYEASLLAIITDQSGQDLNNRLDIETNFQNEVESGGVEKQSISLSASTVESLGSRPQPLQSPVTKRCADGDGQEANEITELEEDQNMEIGLQCQQQEQEVLQVTKETPLHRRSPTKRVSRRPARFRDW